MLWKESYKIGNDVIDSQHHMIFDTIEKMMIYVQSDGDWDERFLDCRSVVRMLRPAALEHFNDEENYMRSINYGGLNAHVEMHRHFVSNLRDFEYSFELHDNKKDTVTQFVGFLLTWLLNHVEGEDQKFIKQKVSYKNPKDETTWSKSLITGASVTMMKLFKFSAKDLSGKMIPRDEDFGDIFVDIGMVGDFKGKIEYGFSSKMIAESIKGLTLMDIDKQDRIVTSVVEGISGIINTSAIQYLDKNGFLCVAGEPEVVRGLEGRLNGDDVKLKILIQSPAGDLTVATNILT